MIRNKTYVTLLSSAARSADTEVDETTLPHKPYNNLRPSRTNVTFFEAQGVHFILDVTAIVSGTITFVLEGYDPASNDYYTVLQGSAISSTGTSIYKIGVGFTPVANATANDFFPAQWRITIDHSGSNSATYSLGAWIYG